MLARFCEDRAVACADDGYIKAKMSVALQVLAELKLVVTEDAGLQLNVAKTSVLPKVSPSRPPLMRHSTSSKQPPH